MFVAWLVRYFCQGLKCETEILHAVWQHLPYQLLHYEARLLCHDVMTNTKKGAHPWVTRGPMEGELKGETAQRWCWLGFRLYDSDSLCIAYDDTYLTIEVQRVIENDDLTQEKLTDYLDHEEGRRYWWAKHTLRHPSHNIFALHVSRAGFWEALLSLLRTFQ
jgi:hypothetical protein